MKELELVLPEEEHEAIAMDYRREHFDNQEIVLHGSSLLDQSACYADWLKQVKDNSREETVRSDWVVAASFFAVRKEDQKIVGMINIRHELNDFLRSYGGHIGYGVRPSERRKGYATRMLEMGLEYCKSIGLQKLMLSCNKDNEASRKTIQKCGGILEKEFLHTDGKTVQIFWITI